MPGGTLMAMAANAAYETVSQDFAIDTLQAHFLSGPDEGVLMQLKVQRLSDSGRFAIRTVAVSQGEAARVYVTCSFVRTSAMKGPSMTHAVGRRNSQTVNTITLDDLEPFRNQLGPYKKFQRLPLVYTGPEPAPKNPLPESLTYTSIATISPPIQSSSPRWQALGIIALSDYHILDAPPTLHGISFGWPATGDATRTRTKNNIERMTSLNHSIRFHVHDGFRADELCYVEASSPWTNARRAEVQSRIFDRAGRLVATCVQGSYYVLKEDGSKL